MSIFRRAEGCDRRSVIGRPVGPERRAFRFASLLLGLVSAVAGVAAEEPDRPSIDIGWTKNAPEIDGELDTGEWADAAHVDGLTQALPDPGEQATQHTEVWIMTDEDHLYLAARMWDSNPDEIVANAMSRDANLRLEDRFSFTIDPFLDRQNGYFFQVNPNAVRRDFLLEGGSGEPSWDGRWYAKTSRDAKGWTVEIAIPYATINFAPDANVWGFNMARGIRRRDEIDRWSDPVRERFVIAMGRAGNLVGMKGIRQGLGLRMIPAATFLRVDDNEDPPIGEGISRRHYTKFDPSFDVFYKATPSMTTALTVNTDFGETEVDERRVNLSRFALFFPEKRDFFLQDALIFDFGDLGRNGRPFFSRRIGLNEEGEPVGILAGAKATGRVGNVKIGVLDVVLDERGRSDQQNLLVARAATNFGESAIGAILTNGDPEANGDNTVVGLDFLYRDSNFRDNKSFSASAWAQGSFNDPDHGPTADLSAVDGGGYAFGGAMSYPNDKHNWKISGRVFDRDFDPALGFANRVGIREYKADYRRRWRPDLASVQTADMSVIALLVTEQGRQIETGAFTWRLLDLRSPIDDGIRVSFKHRYEAVDEPFENFNVPVGRYHFDEIQLRLNASLNRRVGGEFHLGYGSFYDGIRTRTRSDFTFRLSKHFQTGVIYGFDNLRLPGGDENIHVLQARLGLFFNADLSWVTLIQFDSVSDTLAINSRFRWIIEDGREVFLVLNQGFDTRDDVVAQRTAPLAKLQWTFRF
ncbi:MAG: carbohydrate binding family 9 domain-containing protein [bacterium]|nr:carbohydrate binding family 9 domain-containing protein [bacterium]